MIALDIPMPDKCGKCPCFHHDYPMYCQAVRADKDKQIVAPYGLPRPEWCPLADIGDVNNKGPIEPIEVVDTVKDVNDWDRTLAWKCGACGAEIGGTDTYCHECGRAVKWE